MEKHRMYAIICHVGRSSYGLLYESAYCDNKTEEGAKAKLSLWVMLRKKFCVSEHYQCGCQSIIVDKLTPDIIASGATENMTEIR
jgi:hypothetical protein